MFLALVVLGRFFREVVTQTEKYCGYNFANQVCTDGFRKWGVPLPKKNKKTSYLAFSRDSIFLKSGSGHNFANQVCYVALIVVHVFCSISDSL